MVINIKSNAKMNKKKRKNVDDSKPMKRRLLFAGIIATACFGFVIASLVKLQFVKSEEYSKLAYNQQMKNKIISPSRGTIYDSKGEVLAQSITVDTISVNPGKITYANKKKVEDTVVAEKLSQIFSLDYEETLKKVSSDNSVSVIAKKVETSKVEELKTWMKEEKISAGINIDEDTKRYYPYDTLASNLIGFCGDENRGLYGLEERWNSVLTGTFGKVVTARDVNGQAISEENEQYVPAENGSNLYLTIDANIQTTAEKYLEKAIVENKPKNGGNVIIMNPKNGEILAMATYPNYNLNEPFSIVPTGKTEEEWNTLPSEEKSKLYSELWKNRAVSGEYEPGSTFKLLTASIGLEENKVETDTEGDFFCNLSYQVGDKVISCWDKNAHGLQSLRKSLQKSCNPAFMQLGQRIGASTLFKYYKAFGLFDSIGGDIARAYKGAFHKLDDMGPVEVATYSFGQRFEISPLQLITAVSAICNDGILVEPKIVKKIENTDTKSIEVVETKEVRQVISKDTSEKVKSMMQSVITEGTGRHAQVAGYSIGGKSGTSEPRQGKEDEGYVASFIAVSPIENTEVVVLVILYGMDGLIYHGGQTAGPVAASIMSEILPYLGVASNTQEAQSDTIDKALISVPDFKNKTVAEAKNIIKQLGFDVKVNITGDENTILVTDQMPKYGIALDEKSTIYLYTTENNEKVMTEVPNIKGLSISNAKQALKEKNLNIKIEGKNGVVISQDPSFGTQLEEGTVVNVVVKENLDAGY